MFGKKALEMPTPEDALPGRDMPVYRPGRHFVNDQSMAAPYPAGTDRVLFGLGCFWGAERVFWQMPGVHVTAVGYAGGYTHNPTYEEVCSGRTGHTEAVLVVFRPERVRFGELLRVFWEAHDPTQGMRQGNDRGTQYRSAIYTFGAEQLAVAEASKADYAQALSASGYGPITTEIQPAGDFYFAEEYHQQYLAKNPQGYCGIGGTGISCPVGLGVATEG